MKSVLTAVFSLTVIFLFAQTTTEEYNYVTKGYQIQTSSGLDMKRGYEIVSFDEISGLMPISSFGDRDATFSSELLLLYREGEKFPCASLLVISRDYMEYLQFLGIPAPDSSEEIWDRAYADFEKAKISTSSLSQHFYWQSIQLISKLASTIERT